MERSPIPLPTLVYTSGRPYVLPDVTERIWPHSPNDPRRLREFLRCEPVVAEHTFCFIQEADGQPRAIVNSLLSTGGKEYELRTHPHGLVAALSALQVDEENRVLSRLPQHERSGQLQARARASEPIAGALLLSPDQQEVGLWQYGGFEPEPLRCGRLALIGDAMSYAERAHWNNPMAAALCRVLFWRLPSDDLAEEVAGQLVARGETPLYTRSYVRDNRNDPAHKACFGALAIAKDDVQWRTWKEAAKWPLDHGRRYGNVVFLSHDTLLERLREDRQDALATWRARDEGNPATLATRVDVSDALTNTYSRRNWEARRVEGIERGEFPLIDVYATPFADGHGSLVARMLGIEMEH